MQTPLDIAFKSYPRAKVVSILTIPKWSHFSKIGPDFVSIYFNIFGQHLVFFCLFYVLNII